MPDPELDNALDNSELSDDTELIVRDFFLKPFHAA
jgi:hypothetical protein